MKSGVGKFAKGLGRGGVIEDMENVRVLAEEGGCAAIEVELLGESRKEIKGNRWRGFGGVCKDEILNGNDFYKVLVLVH